MSNFVNKILSLFLGVVLGKVKEVRALDNDKNGNPQANMIVTQTNPWSPDNVFDHWIKCWGTNSVKEASHAKVGHYVLVIYKGFPYNRENKNSGQSYPNMQNQAMFIFTLGSLFSGEKTSQDNSGESFETNSKTPPESTSKDDVPF